MYIYIWLSEKYNLYVYVYNVNEYTHIYLLKIDLFQVGTVSHPNYDKPIYWNSL